MSAQVRATKLGETIRRQRELSELSMRQFADLAGISNPYLSQIERARRRLERGPGREVSESVDASGSTAAERGAAVVGRPRCRGDARAAGGGGRLRQQDRRQAAEARQSANCHCSIIFGRTGPAA